MQRILVKESYIVDYAGFWWRLGAFIIDGVILWGINYLMNGLWNLATGLVWSGLTEEMKGFPAYGSMIAAKADSMFAPVRWMKSWGMK